MGINDRLYRYQSELDHMDTVEEGVHMEVINEDGSHVVREEADEKTAAKDNLDAQK